MRSIAALIIIFFIINSCDYRYRRVYEYDYSLTPAEGTQLLSGGSQKKWKIIERTVDGHHMNLGAGNACDLSYRGVFNVNGMYQPGTEEGHDCGGEWVFMQNRPYMKEDEPSEYSYSFHDTKPYLYLHTNKQIEPYLILKLVPDTLIIGSYSYQEWDIVKKDTVNFFVVQTLIPEHIPNETRYHHM